MCLVKTYETRERGVLDPPARHSNFTNHYPAGVMRLPLEVRRSGSFGDRERYVEYRRSQPRALEYYEEPRRRSASRRRVSDVELRASSESYVEERKSRNYTRH